MLNRSTVKNRRSTSYKVKFPSIPSLTTPPTKAYLKQAQGAHDVLSLEFPTVSARWFNTLNTGVPVLFTWKQGGLSKYWYGYVSHVSKEVSPQRQNYLKVVCVASSYVLKERATRVFTNTTVTDAIKTIAKEFNFKSVITDHGRVFEQLTMAGHSYWEWIQEAAKKIGYVAYVDELTLHFRPIDKIIDAGIKACPILSMHHATSRFNNHVFDSTLDYIHILKGEHIESASALKSNKKVAGINPFTGQTFSSKVNPLDVGTNLRSTQSDPLFDEYRYDNVVDSDTAADYSAQASAELGRFNLPADIKGQGDPRLRPYSSFYVDRSGEQTDGFWLVKSITHIFGRTGEYQMEMKALTDGTKSTPPESYRPLTASLVGVIDPQDLINNGRLSLGPESVVLDGLGQVFNETSQNFVQTNTRWKAGFI
jgi:hypothetical protein